MNFTMVEQIQTLLMRVLKAVMPMVPLQEVQLPEVVIAVERSVVQSVVLENHVEPRSLVEPNAPLPSVPLPSAEPGRVGLSVVKLSLEHSIAHNIHTRLV